MGIVSPFDGPGRTRVRGRGPGPLPAAHAAYRRSGGRRGTRHRHDPHPRDGARLPVRLYLYVNGDLAESWTEREASFDFSLDVYGPGRHSVRARAVDAIGRWAGASTILAAVAGAEAS